MTCCLFLRSTAVVTSTAACTARATPFIAGGRARAAPKTYLMETKVIIYQPDLYHGCPMLARRRSGDLLLACSGGSLLTVWYELMQGSPRGAPPSAVEDRGLKSDLGEAASA